MIISHRHKFIFIAIPKTATHAIRIALRPHLTEEDMEQVGLFIKKKFPYETLASIDHGHIKCTEIEPVLGKEAWKEYYKFAVVRNPYDRFVSYCAFMNKGNPDFEKNPQTYMYHALLNKKTHKHILFLPQSEFICDKNGTVMIDMVGKYEQLQTFADDVLDHFGFAKKELEVINTSKHKPYAEYYNDELKEMVYDYYKNDFNNFEYNRTLSEGY
jgi:hypothetical protein